MCILSIMTVYNSFSLTLVIIFFQISIKPLKNIPVSSSPPARVNFDGVAYYLKLLLTHHRSQYTGILPVLEIVRNVPWERFGNL